MFLVLTAMYGVCAHLLTLENYKSAQQLPIRNANLVNLTIMVCFGSRSAIDFAQVISFHGKWRNECCTLSFTSDTDLKVWPVILYFIWEFVPTILTMVFVANATGTCEFCVTRRIYPMHNTRTLHHRYIQSLSIIVL